MFLYEVIYFSEKSDFFIENSEIALGNILREAEENNEKECVTGMLFSSGKYFFQILEGQRSTISSLLFRISHDPRHKNLVVVRARPIAGRRFMNWSMSSIDVPRLELSKFRKYTTSHQFDPSEFSEETIDLFLMTAYTEVVSATPSEFAQ